MSRDEKISELALYGTTQAQSSWRRARVPAVAWESIGCVTLTAAAPRFATRRGATSIHHRSSPPSGGLFAVGAIILAWAASC
jgi:hypothetical protein